MRFFWKALLIGLGGYWLYKKSRSRPSADTEVQPEQTEENDATSQSPPGRGGMSSTEQIIEQLIEIDGVTSRVAENLVEKGIKSKEALLKLSEEELRSVKGIGPKRAEKILNSG